MSRNTGLAMAWIATSIAVSVAVYVTKSPNTLFAFILPALVSNFSDDKNK